MKKIFKITIFVSVGMSLLTCSGKMDPRYLSPGGPTVTSISPNTGVVSGGTTVTITGTNFRSGTGYSVALGGSDCAIQSMTTTQIVCVTSRHSSNAVDVVVTAGDTLETGTLKNGFGYKAFLYSVANSSIFGFAIDPFTGNLTATPSSPYAAAGNGYGISIHPSNKWLYVATITAAGAPAAGSASVYGWAINSSTGQLTALASNPVSANTPAGPDAIAFTSDNRFMFVGGTASPSTVTSYTVNSDGSLTSNGATVTATGCNFASQIVVDPQNANLYISCNGNGSGAGGAGLAAFAINPTTGVLTFTSYTAGGSGDAISMDLTGTYIYTGNTGAASAVGCGVHGVYDTKGGVSVYLANGGTPTYIQSCNHNQDCGSAGTRGSGSSIDQTNRWLVTSARTSGTIQVWDLTVPDTPSLAVVQAATAGTNDARFDKTGRFMYDSSNNSVDYYTFDIATGTPTFVNANTATGSPGVSDVTY